MTKKKPTNKSEDPEQSRRFLDTARELEADGELSPTAGEDFERVFRRVVPEKKPRRGAT